MEMQFIVIEPGRSERHYWHDLWRYRELYRVLVRRDLSVRYKNTVIGVMWALVRPLVTMVVFVVIFGRVAKLPSDGSVPYPLLVFAGMLPWTFYSTGLGEGSNSLLADADLITKVYFPRLIVPTATIVVAFIDLLIGLSVAVVLMAWYRFLPDWRVLFLPAFVGFAFLVSIGPTLWFSALNVQYRDFRYIIPFIIQFGLYISPVGFSSSVIPEKWRLIYSLNPIVGVIDGFRWCLLAGQSPLYAPGLALSLVVALFFLWLGIGQFRKMEKSFADLI